MSREISYFDEEGDDKQEEKQVVCFYLQNSLTTVIVSS